MQNMMMLRRPLTVSVRADSKKDMGVYRKTVETQRSSMLKDTLNKLAIIASAETKFLQTTFADLDKLHRKAFDEMKKDRETVKEDGTNENIFLNDPKTSDKDSLM
jgi:hypothetical protein